MMRYPKTYDEFVNSEIEEHGFDYVDTQFALGFEPKNINGVWFWNPNESITPIARNTSTIPYTPVNLIVTL